MKKMEK